MKEEDARKRAFAMPPTSPAYPPGPYRFFDRKFMVITYRTDPDKLHAVVPATTRRAGRSSLLGCKYALDW
jgi:acetoacetate decarboxylase